MDILEDVIKASISDVLGLLASDVPDAESLQALVAD